MIQVRRGWKTGIIRKPRASGDDPFMPDRITVAERKPRASGDDPKANNAAAANTL